MAQPSNPQDHSKTAVLESGELVFRVRRGQAEVDHTIDLLALKLTCEACEQEHSLRVTEDNKLQPTTEFLVDLAGRLESLGICGCTPTVAWQIWIAAGLQMEMLKNVMSGMPN